MNASQSPSFESQLKELEEIVGHLENGDLSLNDSLSQFEKGVTLSKNCQGLLTQAEQKVLLLNETNNQLEDFK